MIDPCLRVTIAHYPLHSGAQFAGVWFEAVRADAVTCSVKCRVARHRLFQARTPQLPTGTFDLVLVDIDTHFTPNYRPWRQRIAFIPDGDFLKAIRASKASVVTDEIETFTESGWTLRADLVADFVCRLINHMKGKGASRVSPELRPEDKEMPPWKLGLTASRGPGSASWFRIHHDPTLSIRAREAKSPARPGWGATVPVDWTGSGEE